MTRTIRSTAIALLLAVAPAGCGSKTTAPSGAVVSLTLNQQAAIVERNGSVQLSAKAIADDGSTPDVTTTATWTTSNAAVANVTNGLVTITGIGTAQVTATSQGKSATATITGRRRTHLIGVFRLADQNGQPSITGLGAFVDDQYLLSIGTSNPIGTGSVQMSLSINNTKRMLSPGNHVIRLGAGMSLGDYDVTSPPTTLTVVDSDTGEQIGTVVLAQKSGHFRSSGTADYSPDSFSWTIDLAVFDK